MHQLMHNKIYKQQYLLYLNYKISLNIKLAKYKTKMINKHYLERQMYYLIKLNINKKVNVTVVIKVFYLFKMRLRN